MDKCAQVIFSVCGDKNINSNDIEHQSIFNVHLTLISLNSIPLKMSICIYGCVKHINKQIESILSISKIDFYKYL